MTSPPFAQMKCPYCGGIVRPGDAKCKWCLSSLQSRSARPMVNPEQAPVMWSRADTSYGDHVAWKMSLTPGDTVLLQEGEAAAQLFDGELEAALGNGVTRVSHHAPNEASARRVEVLFSKTILQNFKWGEGDLATSDGIAVGASGTISIRGADPARMMRLLPPGQPYLSVRDLRDRVFPMIKSILQKMISEWKALDVLGRAKILEEMVLRELEAKLGGLGLEISGFEIRNLSLPEEFRRAVEKRGIMSLESQAEVANLEQLKKVGVDVNKLATLGKVAEKASGLRLIAGDYVAGDYVAGPAIKDSVVLRSNIGTSGKVNDEVVTERPTVQCPSCKAPMDPLIQRFCSQCGTKVKVCPKCRTVIPDTGRFCYQCGEALF